MLWKCIVSLTFPQSGPIIRFDWALLGLLPSSLCPAWWVLDALTRQLGADAQALLRCRARFGRQTVQRNVRILCHLNLIGQRAKLAGFVVCLVIRRVLLNRS